MLFVNTVKHQHIFLTCLPCYLVIPRLVLGSMTTHLFVTHVGPCAATPTIFQVKEMIITTQDYDSLVTGRFNVTKDVDDGWTVKATMQKCQDIRNTDTCDHFSSYRVVQEGCSDPDDKAYAQLFQHTQPQLKCPVQRGAYQLVQFPVRSASRELSVHEAKISTSVFGYRVLLEGASYRNKLFCVEVYLQLLYLRQHDWLTTKVQAHSTPKSTTTTQPVSDDNDE